MDNSKVGYRSDNRPRPNGPRPKIEWEEAHRETEGNLVVAVSASKGFRRLYSWQAGRLREDGSITQHVGIRVDGDFRITVDPVAEKFAKLMAKAEEWIASDAAMRVNENLDRRIEKETKQANAGKPQTRVTGKTERKKARRIVPAA